MSNIDRVLTIWCTASGRSKHLIGFVQEAQPASQPASQPAKSMVKWSNNNDNHDNDNDNNSNSNSSNPSDIVDCNHDNNVNNDMLYVALLQEPRWWVLNHQTTAIHIYIYIYIITKYVYYIIDLIILAFLT